MKLGTANCYRVFDGNKDFFLKEFQSGFSENDLIREAKLVNFLSKNGIPVARFILTNSHQPFIVNQGRLICLEEYINGNTYGYDNFPKPLLNEMAQMLGKLHCALKNYPLPEDMGESWLASYSVDSLTTQYDKLLAAAEKRPNDSNSLRIQSDMQYKKELVRRCISYKKYYEGITDCPTHGDYHGCQLICGDCHIKAVIDFSSARTLPAVWEIMRSYVQSSAACRKNAVIDVMEFCTYVQEYMKYAPLTKTDLRAMPYVYLVQLVRSKYGYLQYLETTSEDRKRLLQFAFWRTDMCREIEAKAKIISDALLTM